MTPADGDCPDISFSNLSDSSNGQRTTVTGEFTAKNLPDGRSTVPVFVTSVLRDDEGEIVGGATTMIAIVSEEEIVPFEVTVYDVPDYASFELYAQIW